MKHVITALFVLLCMIASLSYAQSPATAQQKTATPLEKVLNPDGTINTKAGFTGSVDPKGYRMIEEPDGAPRFVRSDQSVTSSPDDVFWDPRFDHQGVDSIVWAVAVSGTDVYIGGDFTHIGSVAYNHIAKWNGTSWDSLDSGVNGYSPTVKVIAIKGSDVYVGGLFNTAGGVLASCIAKWNGSSWDSLPGGGTSGEVDAIAFNGSEVYVGGLFGNAGGIAGTRAIAKNIGAGWSAVGGNNPFGAVYAIAIVGSSIYAGGYLIYGDPYSGWSGIARYDGANWYTVGGGLFRYSTVYALTVIGTDLYVGGNIYSIDGGISFYGLGKWDGTAWSSVGGWSPGYVTALTVSGTNLFVGSGWGVWEWDGTNWSTIGIFSGDGSMTANINTLASNGPDLYVGGLFHNAGGVNNTKNVVRWNGGTWFPMFNSNNYDGMSGIVRAITTNGNNVYAGGDFEFAGNVSANNIARWDGTKWDSLGSGITVGGDYGSYVYAIAANGNDVYVGGDFKEVGGALGYWSTGVMSKDIAKWNGTLWDSLGIGTNDIVFAIAVKGDTVYVGGQFTTAGGVSANRIAMWDGSSWSALGSGMDNIVYALAIIGNDLYAGGMFTTAGGNPASRIAKWDGANWTPVGSGMNDFVRCMTTSASELYIGGGFTTAGGVSANNIVKWDGTTWTAIGSGTNGWVRSVSVSGSDLYVGGDFTMAGGTSANYIAKWDGSNWSPLGSGVNQRVRAVAATDSKVYVGGEFLSAGERPSLYFGIWKSYFSLYVSASDGWNMVSLPLVAADFQKSTLYPTASSAAFIYTGSYQTRDTLRNGPGYWVKFDSPQTVEYFGTPIAIETVDVKTGWNMIGSIGTPVAVGSIGSIPGEIVTSEFFGYNGTYYHADNIQPGGGYWVRVNQDGKLILSSSGLVQTSNRIKIQASSELPPSPPDASKETTTKVIPTEFILHQNYPNPFNPGTVISYQIPVSSWVTLKIYNMLGQEVAMLIDGMQDAGYKSVKLDASNLPSGIYAYRIQAGSFMDIKKMLLLR